MLLVNYTEKGHCYMLILISEALNLSCANSSVCRADTSLYQIRKKIEYVAILLALLEFIYNIRPFFSLSIFLVASNLILRVTRRPLKIFKILYDECLAVCRVYVNGGQLY